MVRILKTLCVSGWGWANSAIALLPQQCLPTPQNLCQKVLQVFGVGGEKAALLPHAVSLAKCPLNGDVQF